MNIDGFIQSLEIMWKGMGGIFVVMLIIFVFIKGLIYFFPGEE